jgi:3-deoxy-D-manno-octulosonic-acid transferase
MAIYVASLFNSKARKWLSGRKRMWEEIGPCKQKTIWFHCASLGEFEQARPVIEKIKQENSEETIVLTFFSPSGYEIRKDYPFVDYVYYLPIDLPGKMQAFIDLVNPKLVIFVKYEFWFNCLNLLAKSKIDYIFISAVFRKSQFFFAPIFRWFKKKLQDASMIFVQNEQSFQLLKTKRFTRIIKAGDTRIDSVIELKKQVVELPLIRDFKQQAKLWVCGSIHKSDYEILLPVLKKWNDKHKLVLVPHDIEPDFIKLITKDIEGAILYSEIKNSPDFKSSNCLIIDCVGILSSIYPYADLVYIGGGFGRGIHNILEPAIFEKPILFGPNFTKFDEANYFVQNKGAHSINSTQELSDLMLKFDSDNESFISKNSLKEYFKSNQGASKIIVSWLHEAHFLSPIKDN